MAGIAERDSEPRSRWGRAVDFLLPPAAWGVDLLIWGGDDRLRDGGQAPSWIIPATSAAIYAMLLVRRRFPMTVMMVQLLWATVPSLHWQSYVPVTGMLVALHAVAVKRSPAWSVPALLLCAVPLGVMVYQPVGAWPIGLLVLMLIASAVWGLGYRGRLADLRVAQLTAQREAATAEAFRAEERRANALRVERLRIARELHDIVAHAMGIIIVQAHGARAVMAADPPRAEQALDVIQDIGRQGMEELRRLLFLLRSASDEDTSGELTHQPGLKDLDGLLDNARHTGLTVTKQISGTEGRVDPSVGLTAYRLVQEALTNTLKHAGPKASAQVRLDWGAEQLTVTVEDDGPAAGPAPATARPPSTGHGLLGLRERVTTIGGTLHAGPQATGFVVRASLPLARAAVHTPVRPTVGATPP